MSRDDRREATPAEDGGDLPGLDVAMPHADGAIAIGLTDADVRAVTRAVCDLEGVAAYDVTVVLADHALVHRLNREWLEHDYETDVLSFSLDEHALGRGQLDGEVYVDLDTAAERAPEFGTTPRLEALRYVAHGLLHLAGWDDATDAQRDAMREREDEVLAALLGRRA